MTKEKDELAQTKSDSLPLLIVRNTIIFPKTHTTLDVGREKSLRTIESLSIGDNLIVVCQKNEEIDDPKISDIYKYGTRCELVNMNQNKNGSYTITLKGIEKVKLIDPKLGIKKGFVTNYQTLNYVEGDAKKNAEVVSNILEIITSNLEEIKNNKEINDLYNYVSKNSESYGLIADFVITNLNLNTKKKQIFLECESVTERLEIAFGYLVEFFDGDNRIRESVESTVNKKMSDNISRQQREFYLREKLRTVKEELGELSSKDDEADQIRRKVKNNPYPDYIKDKILSELSKYEAAISSNESGIIKTYIDWLLDLPWWQQTSDNNDLVEVEKALNESHYGLDKIKERILEYLALRTKNKDAKGPILCLVGPPGVGKTSLAKSIAKALNKRYVKVSLGGVKDEAEIRGHRKTYVGAMPGRIIKGMKKAGVINPLFLLDEIDKMASDQKGDPASAMLEVLDPEQNSHFSDNYIEEEYDLSKVMFVATANYYKQIPYALIDRLEVIELSSYTAIEKLHIAKQHLIPIAMKQCLIDETKLKWDDQAINLIIESYTKEAGVRELERQIQKICRKYVVAELKKETLPKVIDVEQVKKYLGKIIFDVTLKDQDSIPGIVNGMAYTSAGGDLLPIECSSSKGKGKLSVTGNLEKTMSESVSVALGYVKANAIEYGINPEVFNDIDIHVHVPAGGVPKDGPSAGVAITSAIISMLKKVPVRTDISMTGEITLRGKVGVIGGVKEKVISAHRAGVREIFIPSEDERFLEEVPKDVLDEIKIHLVKKYDDIYKHLFAN